MKESLKYTLNGVFSRIGREGRAFKNALNNLNVSQYYSKKQLIEFQTSKLKALIKYSQSNIPYYQRLFKKLGLSYKDIQKPDDLKKLPILTKQDILKYPDDFIPNYFSKFFYSKTYTSGTTGMPLTLYRDYYSANYEHATVFRLWSQAGYEYGAPLLTIRGFSIFIASKSGNRYWAIDKIHNELFMSSFHMNKFVIPILIDKLIDFNPKYINCYPQSLLTLLNYARKSNISLSKLDIKGVFTSSEMVPPSLHELVAELLGCKIIDYYNTAERVLPVATCEFGNYHVLDDYGIAEFIPVNKEKYLYEVVGTGLTNKAMPLLRYNTNDLVEMYPNDLPCECGRHFQRVKSIVGRPSEFIIGVDGQEISGAGLTHIFYGIDAQVVESQIFQRKNSEVTLRMVPTDAFSEKNKANLTNSFFDYTGIIPTIEKVSFIERTAAGKYRFIVKEE